MNVILMFWRCKKFVGLVRASLKARSTMFMMAARIKIFSFEEDSLSRRRIRNNVIEFKPIIQRIHKFCLKEKQYNISIICTHATSEEKENMEKENFYE